MTVLSLPHPSADLLGPFLESQTTTHTRIAYSADLRAFFGTELITIDQVTSIGFEDVEQYRNELVAEGKKPTTVNRYLTSLFAFFKRCVALGLIARNPADSALVKRLRMADTSVGKAIAPEHIAEMISLASKHDNRLIALRDVALLKVLLYAGLRRNEACNMQWSDLIVEGGHTIVILRDTKAGTDQHVKLAPIVVEALTALSDALNGQFDYVFVSLHHKSRYGNQISSKAVRDVVVRYGEMIGLKITTHQLRHTCATLAMEGGAKPQQVQSHLRHKDIKTTMRYYTERDALSDNATDYISIGVGNE